MATAEEITALKVCMSLEGVQSITDAQFESAIDDTKDTLTGFTTDIIAIKYNSAYTLARRLDWKALKKSGDVTFQDSNPGTYLDMYNERLDVLGLGASIVVSDPKYNDENA